MSDHCLYLSEIEKLHVGLAPVQMRIPPKSKMVFCGVANFIKTSVDSISIDYIARTRSTRSFGDETDIYYQVSSQF